MQCSLRRWENMVAAIKHWSLATEFMEETPAGTYRPTALASSIFDEPGFDPYSEHVTTHGSFTGTRRRCTTFYDLLVVFNCVFSRALTRIQ